MQIIELMDNIKKQVEELEILIKTDPLKEWLDKSKTTKEK